MEIHTPEGKREVPDCMVDDYKKMSDIELIEILLKQNKRFLDPVLVSLCIDKGLLKKGEAVEDLESKLDFLKVQEYVKLKAENEKLKEELNNSHDIWVENNTLIEINNWQNKEITRLNNQLIEKDEKIEDLQQQVKRRILEVKEWQKDTNILEQKLKFTIKQFCEKIRKVAKRVDYKVPANIVTYTIYEHDLDQIEKGENVCIF